MKKIALSIVLTIGLALSLAACAYQELGFSDDDVGETQSAVAALNFGTYNLHLENTVRFKPLEPGADADNGRALFGVAPDLLTEDTSEAIFEGPSLAFEGVVVSNGRTCFTCHRGSDLGFGLPVPPLSATIALTDTLFTGVDADAQGDPDGPGNLDNHGLIRLRPNRFNLSRPQSDPFRKVFFWRKSPRLINVGLTNGLLLDARARNMFETARGAVFSHTQDSDKRFDDLFAPFNEPLVRGNDIEAFLFSLVSDPVLLALRDPSHPMHDTLVQKPFHTVPIQTFAQWRGKWVFIRDCMSCHNTPNVFNNRSNIEPQGNGARTVEFPPFPPTIARTFDVGVAQQNEHGLRFTHHEGNGVFSPIVIPLVANDGTVVQHTVSFDIGLAATTARVEDVGRFKVPQLRDVKNNAPYFHNNSATTLEEVVDYFNSPAYNSSRDGKRFPIDMNAQERADLIEFLEVL